MKKSNSIDTALSVHLYLLKHDLRSCVQYFRLVLNTANVKPINMSLSSLLVIAMGYAYFTCMTKLDLPLDHI